MHTYKNISKFEAALLIGFCVTMLYCLFCAGMQKSVGDNVLRLHVVANSDSGEDQRLKLCVRDAVLFTAAEMTENAENRDEAVENAEKMLGELQSAAEKALRDAGCDDPVRVTLGDCDFPEKTYGNVKLPAGSYTALNVVIGEGRGHNWWCVMYPALCTSPRPDETLSNSALTPAQRRFITSDGKLEIRFRILEWIRRLSEEGGVRSEELGGRSENTL